MIDQELLHELTESYLKSLISEATNSLSADFDSFAPFGELGIDSFRVLKIIKTLEADFGPLSKTLLFENFNIHDLARYFVSKHEQTLINKFALSATSDNTSAESAIKVSEPKKSDANLKKSDSSQPKAVANSAAPSQEIIVTVADTKIQKTPILMLESDLPKYPELESIVQNLFNTYKNEGSVSRGTRNIAPNIFIGSEKRGYFNYSRSKNIILIYAYTGVPDYLPAISQEIYEHCVNNKLQMNIFSEDVIESIGNIPFSATPFGALQRVLNIQDFTLEGGDMRRLRYQVSKFEKSGVCKTAEYHCGTDKDVDQNIANIIDEWCGARTMVNPLIYIVKDEILAGKLHPQHRLFLTYLNDVLQNVILISEMSSTDNGYLMDLEFYPRDMPLGGLEYAIVKMIEILVAEGRNMLSLGGTYGCRLTTSNNADLEVDKILDDLHKQNIFNDEGNLQFKNKFRPENKTIYLCRPVGMGNPDSVIDIIMMIADPSKMQTSDEEHHNAGQMPQGAQISSSDVVVQSANASAAPNAAQFTPKADPILSSSNSVPTKPVTVQENLQISSSQTIIQGEKRSAKLAEFGFNPLNIPDELVDFDLKTDSWAQLQLPAIEKQMKHLHTQLQQPANLDESLKAIFPFSYFVLTPSGRAAENILCKAWPNKGLVPQNLLFPTCIFHQIDKGFTPKEIPDPQVFQLHSTESYKGNLDYDALQACITQGEKIAFVCIELNDNAAGGHPVSLAHLKKVKSLLTKHAISLVIDGTRVLENAQFIIENEPEYAAKTIWDVAQELFSYADVVIGSLAKDFCVNKGGIIATNDEKLLLKLQDLVQEESSGLDIIDKKLIALSLQNRKQIEAQVVRRISAVKSIWQALSAKKIPVVYSVGGHCVLIDVKQIQEFSGFEQPVASFIAWMYLNTGIRAGAHSVGMQKNTSINGLVRLAIPVGLKQDQVDELIARLVTLFDNKTNIPEITMHAGAVDQMGDVHANYTLKQYHKLSGSLGSVTDLSSHSTQALSQPVAANVVVSSTVTHSQKTPVAKDIGSHPIVVRKNSSQDIAIVGMAGRYPKAKNLNEMWENLVQGRDCIESIPDSRFERRTKHDNSKKYRGGFIDDIDKFDSLFFNISPREAETMDPQERLFLEVAWETIEDAGYYPETMSQENASRNIGVFVGAVWAMYQTVGAEERLMGNEAIANSFLWTIANRVSYSLNLSGPSLTVDTACSSSLTAIYLACEAINTNQCSSALVGGVNLDAHQSKQETTVAGGALSSDGVCRSFGKGANGYVAGEGIGAIFLKPLDQAIQDGDHIYGVIKSAVVNHGGRTSGYSVPNPNAQAELISSALEKANIDARTIGYIEAHGTGTELGDPIEITGLTKAFHSYKVDNQSCAVGSIKTNIGHLEAAAGIASVCKVLLQMKHRKIVPSLHSSELNEFIDFENSPFYVEQGLTEWKAKEVDGFTPPLRAGISSFGAGGSNAHVIIESYDQPSQSIADSNLLTELIFPLSARTEDQLRETAIRLKKYVEDNVSTNDSESINRIAYTLQVGRKSFDHRLVIVAATRAELLAKLTLFIDGKSEDKILSGHVKNADGVTKLLNRKEKEEFIKLLSQSRDPQRLAQLWIEGLLTDWQGVQVQFNGTKIPLPTYPFADRRHWISSQSKAQVLSVQPKGMHPLIDTNESTFERQIFKKTFTDQEFFIYDHLVSDIPTLPGVAYLELARKAGEMAAGRKVQKIKNILWINPLTVKNSVPNEVYIDLKPSGDMVQFEVFSTDGDGKRLVYSQGKLSYATKQEATAESEYVDLESIRARCSKVIDGHDAYPLFHSLGLHLGPSFQVVQEVFKNEKEVLGSLKIPSFRSDDFHNFILHPSLVDGSFQAGMAAALGNKVGEMFVPYSIGEVEILHPLTQNCYSYVTEANENKKANSKLAKSNVLIVGEDGKVLVKIRESVGVPLVNVHEKPVQHQDADGFAKLYYSHIWENAPLNKDKNYQDKLDSILLFAPDDQLRNLYKERFNNTSRIILVQPGEVFEALGEQVYRVNPQSQDDYNQLFESLKKENLSFGKISYAWPVSHFESNSEFVKDALDKGVYGLLALCKSLADQKLESKIQLQYVYASKRDELQLQNDAINGFIKTLQLEHSKLVCKVLDVQQDTPSLTEILDLILTEFYLDADNAMTVRYEDQVRYVRKLKEYDLVETSNPNNIGLKQGGTYLITGGAGGLGLIFAEYLAKEFKAKLILTGRSTLSAEREADLEKLRSLGAEVIYFATDVSSYEAAKTLIENSKAQFGVINGIIHSAGVTRDSYIKNKTRQEMEAVLASKVYGTLYLDELTKADDLDFFVLFSSMSAVSGNAGQCDYSYGNHFMDSFAQRRELSKLKGERSGKTLSLNWSIWANGGMKLDEQTELFFKKNLGIKPLSNEMGIDAFVKGLASDKHQFAVLEGVQEKIESAWGLRKKEVPVPPPAAAVSTTSGESPILVAAAANNDDVVNLIKNELSQIVVKFLKLDIDDVDQDKILLDLGFDSIGLSTYANAINEKYQLDITPVMFFEYPSIGEIAKNLYAEYTDAVLKVHKSSASKAIAPIKTASPAVTAAVHEETQETAISYSKGWTPDSSVQIVNQDSGGQKFSLENRFVDMPIAIVGMSGVMPQSEDLEEFWDNLKNAKNMVTVIPKDRWIWEEYDGDPLKEVNKTNSRWGGFMKEVDKFDPLFFGIGPREAEMMDPQQRIFLETVWKAIEDSGQKVSDLSGTKTGLFVGVATNDYTDLMNSKQIGLDGYTASGNAHSILVNRISFLLNLRGPSAPIDTACSSSLVALHRALESIHTGSCDMAIVGGVQVMLTPAAYISFSMAGMLSGDGKCKTFDKNANGYVRGEGSGAIFLKPLSMAEADGNHIYAVIKSTAENHGGRVTTLTAPNPTAQTDLLVEAYQSAQIDPTTIGYIECHGTGTSLGDPIEIQALNKSFSELYKQQGKSAATIPHCGLGSVKTNIGHLETAAGISGLLKVLLAMKHKQIPASLHFEELNPYINLGNQFYIVDKTKPWEPLTDAKGNTLPRRAGVSSFGFGGANAHVVLEEYISSKPQSPTSGDEQYLIVLSAKNFDRLSAYAKLLLTHIERYDDDLIDIAYTLQMGRATMEERLGILVSSREQLREKLLAFVGGEENIEDLYLGNIKRDKDSMSIIGQDNDVKEMIIAKWMSGKKYSKILNFWTKGLDVEWNKIYSDFDKLPKRISLPTYPFMRDRYWIDDTASRKKAVRNTSLHTYLHENVSTFDQQAFNSKLDSDDLKVHSNSKQLIGLFFPEIFRAANDISYRDPAMTLSNIVWNKPPVVNGEGINLKTEVVNKQDNIIFKLHDASDDKLLCIGKRELSGSEDRSHSKPSKSYLSSLLEEERENLNGQINGNNNTNFQLDNLSFRENGLFGQIKKNHDKDKSALKICPEILGYIWDLLPNYQYAKNRKIAFSNNALPLSLEKVVIYKDVGNNIFFDIKYENDAFDIDLYDDNEDICLSFTRFRLLDVENFQKINLFN